MSRTQKIMIFCMATMPFISLISLFLPFDEKDPTNSIVNPIMLMVGVYVGSLPVFYRQITSGELTFKGWRLYAGIITVSLFSIVVINFAYLFKLFGLKDDGNVVHDGYVSLYFSIVTWTTLGYGDIVPVGYSRPFAAAEALAGQIGLVVAISLFAFLWNSSVNSKSDYS